jgi:hypothetical protein
MVLCFAQDVDQKTQGPCSPAIVTEGNVTVTCQGLDKRLVDQLIRMLNNLTKGQAETETLVTKLDQCIAQSVPRRLTQEQRSRLIAAMRSYAGQRVTVLTILGDPEAKRLAEDFVEVIRLAGWVDDGGSGVNQGVFTKDPMGVHVTVNEADVANNRYPAPAEPLARLVGEFGLAPPVTIHVDKTASGIIKIVVGRKN